MVWIKKAEDDSEKTLYQMPFVFYGNATVEAMNEEEAKVLVSAKIDRAFRSAQELGETKWDVSIYMDEKKKLEER